LVYVVQYSTEAQWTSQSTCSQRMRMAALGTARKIPYGKDLQSAGEITVQYFRSCTVQYVVLG